ncbi:MAG: MoaD/ThiS family protein [Desulfitobacteriaceae bacterium]
MPKVLVKFYASVRMRVGCSSLEMDVVEDLMTALLQLDQHLGINLFEDLDKKYTILINGRNYALGDKVLRQDDRLAFITLAGGG